MHELLGKTLGDFEILRELGRGGKTMPLTTEAKWRPQADPAAALERT